MAYTGGAGVSQDLDGVCQIGDTTTTPLKSAKAGTNAELDGTNGAYGLLTLGRGGNMIQLRSTGMTGFRIQVFDDMNGTVPVKLIGSFTTAMVGGQTSYLIPHGFSFTPSYADVVSLNAVTGTTLAPGYSIHLTATDIEVKLNTASGATGSFNVNWMAYK